MLPTPPPPVDASPPSPRALLVTRQAQDDLFDHLSVVSPLLHGRCASVLVGREAPYRMLVMPSLSHGSMQGITQAQITEAAQQFLEHEKKVDALEQAAREIASASQVELVSDAGQLAARPRGTRAKP